MAEKKEAKPGDVVQLKHQETSFVDAETGFSLTRDEKKPLGDTIGKRTQRALVSGGILVVGGKVKPDTNAEPAPKTGGKKKADEAKED